MEVDRPAVEPPLVHQLQFDAGVVGAGARPAARDDGHEEHVAFVDQAGPDRRARELRPAAAEIAVGCRLDPAYCFGVEVSADAVRESRIQQVTGNVCRHCNLRRSLARIGDVRKRDRSATTGASPRLSTDSPNAGVRPPGERRVRRHHERITS